MDKIDNGPPQDAQRRNLSRRTFLKTTAATAAAACAVGSGCDGQLLGKSKKIPLGVQLYSVRTECQKDLPGTIEAVADIGYQGVEFAGYYDYSAKDLRKLLDDNGLKCCGTHAQLDTLLGENLPKTIEFNKIIGNKYLIVPWLDPEKYNSVEGWKKAADMFNELAEKVEPHNMQVGYHNHWHEFKPIDGQVPWDIFFGNTRKDVIMQCDTGNAMIGGGEVIPYLKRYPGRAVTIHLKEYSATNKNAVLGEGDIPWEELLTLCETIGGTKWYIIEEEKDVYPPLEAVKLCYKNFRKLRPA
ncbi:MAG: sugar phosphate isomerase/epimerase [Sedimentisphaerales bacterium]|nr:sugar phosphate isomerase/epimerase [Sedimentisphaerales bacterium]